MRQPSNPVTCKSYNIDAATCDCKDALEDKIEVVRKIEDGHKGKGLEEAEETVEENSLPESEDPTDGSLPALLYNASLPIDEKITPVTVTVDKMEEKQQKNNPPRKNPIDEKSTLTETKDEEQQNHTETEINPHENKKRSQDFSEQHIKSIKSKQEKEKQIRNKQEQEKITNTESKEDDKKTESSQNEDTEFELVEEKKEQENFKFSGEEQPDNHVSLQTAVSSSDTTKDDQDSSEIEHKDELANSGEFKYKDSPEKSSSESSKMTKEIQDTEFTSKFTSEKKSSDSTKVTKIKDTGESDPMFDALLEAASELVSEEEKETQTENKDNEDHFITKNTIGADVSQSNESKNSGSSIENDWDDAEENDNEEKREKNASIEKEEQESKSFEDLGAHDSNGADSNYKA